MNREVEKTKKALASDSRPGLAQRRCVSLAGAALVTMVMVMAVTMVMVAVTMVMVMAMAVMFVVLVFVLVAAAAVMAAAAVVMVPFARSDTLLQLHDAELHGDLLRDINVE